MPARRSTPRYARGVPVGWSDQDDAILGGDLAAVLAYCTPAGGSVPAAVAPIGLRDRERGEVTFTTSLGLGRKLERIRANPRVALAYHAREHGFATGPRYVLVQGQASFDPSPDQSVLDEVVMPASVRFMGPPRTGFFWDRYLREYYADRVLVTVAVERVLGWPNPRCDGEPEISGAPLPDEAPPPQAPPKKGSGPRVDVSRAAKRLRSLPHVLLAFPGADGFPLVYPVEVGEASERGIALRAAEGLLPPGGRRAGLLGHRFNAKLIGIESRQYTGWLEVERRGRDLRPAHRGRLPRPREQDPAAARQRPDGQAGTEEGEGGRGLRRLTRPPPGPQSKKSSGIRCSKRGRPSSGRAAQEAAEATNWWAAGLTPGSPSIAPRGTQICAGSSWLCA